MDESRQNACDDNDEDQSSHDNNDSGSSIKLASSRSVDSGLSYPTQPECMKRKAFPTKLCNSQLWKSPTSWIWLVSDCMTHDKFLPFDLCILPTCPVCVYCHSTSIALGHASMELLSWQVAWHGDKRINSYALEIFQTHLITWFLNFGIFTQALMAQTRLTLKV